MDVVIERYDAVHGDIENETGEIGDVAPGPPIPGRGQAEGASWFNRRCPDGGTPSGMI